MTAQVVHPSSFMNGHNATVRRFQLVTMHQGQWRQNIEHMSHGAQVHGVVYVIT